MVLSFAPFRPRTLAVKLGPPPATISPVAAVPLDLPFNLDGISRDDARTDGDFDGAGHTLAGELLPATLVSGGIPLPDRPAGARKVERPRLHAGRSSCFRRGNSTASIFSPRPWGATVLRPLRRSTACRPTLTVPDWAEPVGQWNSRIVGGERQEDPAKIAPAYAKNVPVAWVGTHRHGADAARTRRTSTRTSSASGSTFRRARGR